MIHLEDLAVVPAERSQKGQNTSTVLAVCFSLSVVYCRDTQPEWGSSKRMSKLTFSKQPAFNWRAVMDQEVDETFFFIFFLHFHIDRLKDGGLWGGVRKTGTDDRTDYMAVCIAESIGPLL